MWYVSPTLITDGVSIRRLSHAFTSAEGDKQGFGSMSQWMPSSERAAYAWTTMRFRLLASPPESHIRYVPFSSFRTDGSFQTVFLTVWPNGMTGSPGYSFQAFSLLPAGGRSLFCPDAKSSRRNVKTQAETANHFMKCPRGWVIRQSSRHGGR